MGSALMIVLLLATICGVVGALWTVVIAIKNEELLMGIGGLICGILLFVYAIQNLDECKIPLVLMLVGTVASVVLRFMAAAGP